MRNEKKEYFLLFFYYLIAFCFMAFLWKYIVDSKLLSNFLNSDSLTGLLAVEPRFAEKLLSDSIKRYIDFGDADIGGFMLAFEEDVHIAAVRAIDGPNISRKHYPYISNFNLQYDIAKIFVDVFGLSAQASYHTSRILSVVGMGLSVALICIAICRNFSRKHAIGVLAVFCLSPLLMMRVWSAYWMVFLMFLPFAASWLLYPRWRDGISFAWLLMVIGGLTALKALTGYEYLSNIALSAAVPVIFYEFRDNGGVTALALRRSFVRVVLIGLACVAGFLIAAALHVARTTAFFGNIEEGLQAIIVPFAYSTIGSETGIKGGFPPLVSIAYGWFRTFFLYNAQMNLLIYPAVGWVLWCWTRSWISINPQKQALLIAFAMSAISTVSWSLLAIKHSYFHPHINWLQMYLCLNIFAVLTFFEFLFTERTSNSRFGVIKTAD